MYEDSKYNLAKALNWEKPWPGRLIPFDTPMGVFYIFKINDTPQFKVGRNGSGGDVEIEAESYYVLDSKDDFLPFLHFGLKKKGQSTAFYYYGVFYFYTIESLEVSTGTAMPNGRVSLTVKYTLKLMDSGSTSYTPPWELPPYNFRISGERRELSEARFYPAQGDCWYDEDWNDDAPLVNTAGVQLENTLTRGISSLNFDFNIHPDDFDPTLVYDALDRINESSVTICGIDVPARSVKVEKYDGEYCVDFFEYVDSSSGDYVSEAYPFYKISVSLTIDPRTFNQQYLNVGTHIRSAGGLVRLWKWTINGAVQCGSYYQYLASGADDGEEVSENMFLNYDGDAVSELGSDGRQIPTYRYGSPYKPLDFDCLLLPTTSPYQWNPFLGKGTQSGS